MANCKRMSRCLGQWCAAAAGGVAAGGVAAGGVAADWDVCVSSHFRRRIDLRLRPRPRLNSRQIPAIPTLHHKS